MLRWEQGPPRRWCLTASVIAAGRTLLCIVLYRKVNSLEKDRLLFITSRRAFIKKKSYSQVIWGQADSFNFPSSSFPIFGKAGKSTELSVWMHESHRTKEREEQLSHTMSWNHSAFPKTASGRTLNTATAPPRMGTEPVWGQNPHKPSSL